MGRSCKGIQPTSESLWWVPTQSRWSIKLSVDVPRAIMRSDLDICQLRVPESRVYRITCKLYSRENKATVLHILLSTKAIKWIMIIFFNLNGCVDRYTQVWSVWSNSWNSTNFYPFDLFNWNVKNINFPCPVFRKSYCISIFRNVTFLMRMIFQLFLDFML